MTEQGFIPPHGHYEELLSYQKAQIVYDLTFRFCNRFLKKGDRTIDQMVQAARSGKQDIVEGCTGSGTSKEMEIKLLGVARASPLAPKGGSAQSPGLVAKRPTLG